MNYWQKFLRFQINTECIDFDFSSIGLDDQFIGENNSKIERALKQMQELEAGSIANLDENRMVGHYWLRNPALAPSSEISNQIENEISKIEKFSKNSDNYTDVLFIGIGGSALGPQLLVESLESNLNFFFFDNTDPNTYAKVFSKIDCSKTLVVIVSKSGGTTETLNGMLETQAFFKSSNANFEKNAIAITCKSSKLDKLAESWLARFYIWDWVGGRTSLFSAVGLLPLALSGYNIREFLSSAHKIDQSSRQKQDNPALILALSWLKQKDKNMLVIPYSDRLVLFSRYLQQLVMESIGKELDIEGNKVNEGINVFGNKGSTDQHALIQQLRDGRNDFFLTFVNILKTNSGLVEDQDKIKTRDHLFGFYLGTKKALSDSDRNSLTINIKELNHKSLACLIAVYERAVGYYASFLNINAYNQPGVEAGKKAAKKIIELKKKLYKSELFKNGATLQKLSEELSSDKIQLYELLNFMLANDEAVITANPENLDQAVFKSKLESIK